VITFIGVPAGLGAVVHINSFHSHKTRVLFLLGRSILDQALFVVASFLRAGLAGELQHRRTVDPGIPSRLFLGFLFLRVRVIPGVVLKIFAVAAAVGRTQFEDFIGKRDAA
jgi:hypothetical protein